MVSAGFIGLGLMGKPMSKRLLHVCDKLVVYNRSRKSVDELVGMGAEEATNPKEVAERCDIVFTMVPDSPDVRQVILGGNGVAEGVRRNGIVVDCSTVSPLLEVEIAEELKAKSVYLLDAPVTGGTPGAEAGTLTFMVGGNREAFDRCMTLFKAMGKNIFYMGESGMGSYTKLCNQIAVSLNLLGTCEALLVASKAGLDPREAIKVLGTGAAESWQLLNLGPKMVERDFKPGFKIKHLVKDLRIAHEVCEEMGVPIFGSTLTQELLRVAKTQGLGDSATPALILALENLAKHQI
jgi:3-hydroxyisobutyrate dehydrogenase-like beta-hydroxyacid dehydrogenase